jgi:hypothetical protein
LRSWCDQNNISYRAVLDFIRERDEIIDQMLTEEMDVFSNVDQSLARATEDDFMNIITKIKYCIYDGYRNNILIRDGQTYRTLSGLEVLKPKIF